MKGFASLPVTLLIGGMLVEIAIAGVFVAYYLSQSGFGVKYSQDALAAAQAGIQDALIKIVRNKDFSTGAGSYTVVSGANSAQVSVCKDTCAGAGKTQIDSTGAALMKQRKLRAVVNINSLTGEVRLESENEIAL